MDKQENNLIDNQLVEILNKIDEINHLKDIDAILDGILYEARKISNADAGSIFLVENDRLRFAHVQNDTLFKHDETNAAHYADFTVPIDETSIVGYVAKTGETLVIEDAYQMDNTLPYQFNPQFDHRSGYRTTSILTIPLKTFDKTLVGVLELINAKDDQNRFVPFSQEDEVFIPLFANKAAVVIERGIMNRELILRMIRMAELRDPSETGAHVQRVGAYSAEIYKRWALNRNIGDDQIKQQKDLLRLASMLHDVGKVGISDAILKKPAKLTDFEYDVMKWHTVFGARLFVNEKSPLDQISSEIALNHHEKWNGKGYPGKIEDLVSENLVMGKPKSGEDIPLSARITALADVFDALSSKRSYKEPWPDEKILDIITEESGNHFDPDVVEAFFQILDVIKAIREKYRD